MNGSKLFGIVFAAVLLANLATPIAQRLWDAAASGRIAAVAGAPPSGYAPLAPSSAPTPTAIPAPETIGVRFENAANSRENVLTCWMAGPDGFARFLFLEPQGARGFDALSKGAQVRCSFALGGGSSTILTYFNLIYAGAYTVSVERVACGSCKGQDWRWATVVRDPSGHSDYTRFDEAPNRSGAPTAPNANGGRNSDTDRFIAAILDRIRQHWARPKGVTSNFAATLSVRLLPSGDVVAESVRIARSSGDAAFDESVATAVRLASPLPVPAGPAFEPFRELELRFVP